MGARGEVEAGDLAKLSMVSSSTVPSSSSREYSRVHSSSPATWAAEDGGGVTEAEQLQSNLLVKINEGEHASQEDLHRIILRHTL